YLAERLHGLGQIDGRLLDVARQRLFDNLASYAFGTATGEGGLMRSVLDTTAATPNVPTDMIRYACAVTRHTEVDDIHHESCTTIGSIVIPAAVVAACFRPLKDTVVENDVLAAVVAGYEAMARLGLAVDGAIRIYQGIWPTYLAAPFATAAVVARMARYDVDHTAQALAIAASRCVGTTGRMAGALSSRWFAVGCAAAEGYLAARAAAVDMIGDLAVLEQAFPRLTGADFDVACFMEEKSGHWFIEDVDAKSFRSSRQGLAATQAYLRLMEGQSEAAIQSIDVETPEQVRAMVDQPKLPANGRSMGVQYQLALATLDSLGLWDVGQQRAQDAAELQAVMDKVHVKPSEKLTALYPKWWGGKVEVRWRDGRVASLEVLDPSGSARVPFGWPELLEKHQTIARAAGGPEPAWLRPLYELSQDFGQTDRNRSAELLALLPGLESLAQ
ncbi:MAG: MmgE/PrpD family protein, partial [Chloroflexota bacterium]